MPGNLYIVGAGGFGREVFNYVRECREICEEFTFRGFLDGNPEALLRYEYPFGVVGDPDNWEVRPGDVYLLGVGLPNVKKKIVQNMVAQKARFLTLIHPSAWIGQGVQLGAGCIVCPRVVLTCDIQIGDFVVLNVASTVGHDARIGSWSTLSGHCDVTGFVQLGESVLMGSHACVIPGLQVGDNAVLGAGSTIVRRVKNGQTVFGVPAKHLF